MAMLIGFRSAHMRSLVTRSFSTAEAVQTSSASQAAEELQLARSRQLKVLTDRYPNMRRYDVPTKLLDMPISEIEKLEDATKKEFGFQQEELRFVMRHKPTFILWQDTERTGMRALDNFFVKKYGFDGELVRTLVVKYPHILSKTEAQLESVFTTLEKQGVDRLEAVKLVFECPKLLSVKLDKRMETTFDLFDLYHGIKQEQVMDIFRAFPYLFCCDMDKMRLFMAHFRKYKFSPQEIIDLSKNSGGLLAIKVQSFTGFFDYMKRNHQIKASELRKILETYPELVLQNRRDLIHKKFELIKENSPQRTDCYVRNLFRRHPDLFLTSHASMVAKVNYLKRQLNRQVYKEKAFPLLLHFNYSTVIWPRCELLRSQGHRYFDLGDACKGTDKEFCRRFGLDLSDLEAKKAERKEKEEKDKLWVYVPGI